MVIDLFFYENKQKKHIADTDVYLWYIRYSLTALTASLQKYYSRHSSALYSCCVKRICFLFFQKNAVNADNVDVILSISHWAIHVVAGAGFEPTTFGLWAALTQVKKSRKIHTFWVYSPASADVSPTEMPTTANSEFPKGYSGAVLVAVSAVCILNFFSKNKSQS